jgi:Ca2+-binding RTX toxin-like protein
MEYLERRELMAADISFSNGIVTIHGTDSDDIITVRQFSRQVQDQNGRFVRQDVLQATVQDALNPRAPVVSREFTPSLVNRIVAYGLAGNDVIRNNTSKPSEQWGDAGNDTLIGGSSTDVLYAGTGIVRSDNFENFNSLDGGGGDDTLIGNAGKDTMKGRDGNDWLYGYGGDDDISGGNHDDHLFSGGGIDTLHGDAGNDELVADSPFGGDRAFLYGGADDDVLVAFRAPAEMYGEAGNDQLFGGLGNDWLDGGENDDDIFGNEGKDVLIGGQGNDLLQGGIGDDELYGGGDNDELFGELGNDYCDGGAGDDLLFGGEDWDELVGGEDDDTFYFDLLDSVDGTWGSALSLVAGHVVDGEFDGYWVWHA